MNAGQATYGCLVEWDDFSLAVGGLVRTLRFWWANWTTRLTWVAPFPVVVEDSESPRDAGSSCIVVRGSIRSCPVAIKKVFAEYRSSYARELSALRQIQPHPSIIGIRRVRDLQIVMELAQHSLADVYSASFVERGEPGLRAHFVQMLHALRWIHSRGIAHRDIKLDNWLVVSGVLKLADFGLACRCTGHARTEWVGTMSYCMPDVLARHAYNGVMADTWGTGVCLFAMATGFFPYMKAHPDDWRFRTCYEHSDNLVISLFATYDLPCALSTSLQDLLHAILSKDRIGRREMERHAWVGGAR